MLTTDNITYEKFRSALTYINCQKWNVNKAANVPVTWLSLRRVWASENRSNNITIYAAFSTSFIGSNTIYIIHGLSVFSKLTDEPSTW